MEIIVSLRFCKLLMTMGRPAARSDQKKSVVSFRKRLRAFVLSMQKAYSLD